MVEVNLDLGIDGGVDLVDAALGEGDIGTHEIASGDGELGMVSLAGDRHCAAQQRHLFFHIAHHGKHHALIPVQSF